MNDFQFNNNFNQFQLNNAYWNRYDSMIKELSSEQKNFVSKQKNVLQAKQNLMTAFIDYLFEQNKNTFVMANESARNLADEYLNSISKAASSYVSKQEELEKQNARLEKEKAELEKQLQQFMLDFGEKNGNSTTAK